MVEPRSCVSVKFLPGPHPAARSARLFASGILLEAILVGRFYTFRNTVLRKRPKRGVQKVNNLAGDCGDCGANLAIWCWSKFAVIGGVAGFEGCSLLATSSAKYSYYWYTVSG